MDAESSSVLQLQDARDGRMHDRVYYTCKQWFHVTCVNACSSVVDSSDAWFCSSCL